MAGMTRKEIATVLQGLADQGCELVPKKNGTVVRFPNGGHTSFHYSQSDTNDRKYSRALIRRNGLKWPLDGEHPKKKEPIVARTIDPSRYAAVRKLVAEREAQGVTNHPTATLSKPLGFSEGTIRKIMAQDGYVLSRKHGVGWTKPEPAEVKVEPKLVVPGYGAPYFTGTERPHAVAPEPKSLPTEEYDATLDVDQPIANSKPLADKKPEVQTEQKRPEEREFIDTHDSWAIDNFMSIKDLTVAQLVAAYHAAGLEVELRVWRTS